MGFSKSSAEGRRRELCIFRRVIVGAVIAATGLHLSSAPWVMQLVNGMLGDLEVELADDAIEFFVVDEAVPEPETPVTPPPPSAEATDNEPAASASEDSAPPLKTSESVIPTPPTAESIDTIATESAIATEDGVEGGQGAAGNADTIGLISGDGSLEGDPTAPVGPPNVRQREPVPEVARARPPAARQVACNPCTEPDYPLSELRENVQGQPIVNLIFDGNGNILEAVIERSSGNAAFDQAVLAEARANWRLQDPYGLGGQVSVEVPFVIEGTEQFEAVQSVGPQTTIELPVQNEIVPVTPATAGPPATPTAAPDPGFQETLDEAISPDADIAPDPEDALEDSSREPPQPLEDAAPAVLEPPLDEPEAAEVTPPETESADPAAPVEARPTPEISPTPEPTTAVDD